MSETIVEGAPEHALAAGEARARYVRGMFARIVPDYDLVNRIQSMGMDQRWRRRTLDLLDLPARGRLLDLCCGTGDLALAARRRAPGLEVVGGDFCAPMVEAARRKGEGLAPPLRWLVSDALRLPFPDQAFDRISVGFGVRNFADLDAGLAELRRVLRPGGRLGILESSTVQVPGLGWLSRLYLRRVIPALGSLLSRDPEAYRYLPETVLRFPDQEGLKVRLESAGFAEVRYENQLFGCVAIHVGTAP